MFTEPAGDEILMAHRKNDKIDLHVHLFPERLFKAVWNYFEFFNWNVHHELVEDISKTLKAHGITKAVGLSYPHKKGISENLNLFMESVGKNNDMFYPFASVHPDDENFKQYTDYALDSPYIFGFKFQPLVQRFDINDNRLDYLYKQCIERDVPLTIHIGTGPINMEFVGPQFFRRLMKKYKDLRVCVPHMGAMEYNDFLYMLDDHPNMYLDTTMINTRTDLFDTTYYGDMDKLLSHTDRICFGSDWPNVPYPYQEALDSIERFGFSKENVDQIFNENAITFLNIN